MLFTSDRIVRGSLTHQYDEPEWDPCFVYLWPDEIRDEDEPGTYREVDPQHILKEVLRQRGE
jgi:hypothetical protein